MSTAYEEFRALLFGMAPYERDFAPEATLLGELVPVLSVEHLRRALSICSTATFIPFETRVAVVARALEPDCEAELRPDVLQALTRHPTIVRWLPMSVFEGPRLVTLIDACPEDAWVERAEIVAEVAARGRPGSQNLVWRELERIENKLGTESQAPHASLRLLRQLRGALSKEHAILIERMSQRVHGQGDRSEILAAALPLLTGSDRTRLEETAVESVRAEPDMLIRARALLTLANACREPMRSALLREAPAGLQTLGANFDAQVDMLAALAPRLPPSEREALLQAVRDEYADRRILSPSADEALARAFALAAGTLPAEYHAALAEVVQRLVLDGKAFSDPHLRNLVPFLSSSQLEAALTAAAQSWRNRDYLVNGAGSPAALGAIAPYLSPLQVSGVLGEILEVVKYSDLIGADLLTTLAPTLPTELATAAARIAVALSSPWWSGRVLLALKERLPESAWMAYEGRAYAVSPERLRALASDLSQHERDDILATLLDQIWERYAGAPPKTRKPVKKAAKKAAPGKKAAPPTLTATKSHHLAAEVEAPVPNKELPLVRRLIAEAIARGKKRKATLLPNAKHQINVWIAIPQDGDLYADQPFPEQDLPSGELVPLTVHVACEALELYASQEILLSMIERTVPSTVAAFEFRTGAERLLVDIKILVTHRGRPMQEVHLVASVRAKPVRADQIRLMTVPLSASPEPREETTEAQESLEVNGPSLERTGTNRKVDLSQLRPLLDGISETASRVLGADDAPETLDHEAARELLIDLARVGSDLKDFLAPLGLGNAGTVSLLVDATTEILPLEIAYDAEAPDENAKVCQHRAGGSMVGLPRMCDDAGTGVVCPFGFWGQRRVVARTIRLAEDDEPKRQATLESLRLRPVLYAAATRADQDTTGPVKPTQYLAEQIESLVGAANVLRVSNWDDWRDAVRKHHPQLLVVLGHTEISRGETILEIGENSWLRRPDVHGDVLFSEGGVPPLVVLLGCSTAVARDPFGGLPAKFTARGAAAVIATLSKIHGPHGAKAAAAVVRAICEANAGSHETVGGALKIARRRLLEQGLLDGLLLVSHGEIDVSLR